MTEHVLQCLIKDRKKEEIGNEENNHQKSCWGTITGDRGVFGEVRCIYQKQSAQIREKKNKKKQYRPKNNVLFLNKKVAHETTQNNQ